MIRVLILEDVAADADLVEIELRRAGLDVEVQRVVTRPGYEGALREFRPDVIISDHDLPHFTGAEALELARAVLPCTPFLLVTGSLNEEMAVAYMKAGAADYILKDRLARLAPAVRTALERRRLECQFLQAQKMEAVGRLAGGVAHDFNNVLTAILGYAELLLDGLPALSPLRPDLEEIRKSAGRGAGLTRQLLTFSRQQVLDMRVLDLNELVGNMDKLLRRLLGEDIDIVTKLADGLGAVRADAGQLEQVLINLAVNARDAMPEGGQLTIETQNVDTNVMVAVSDTGVGMSAETMSHMFEPFFTTKQPGEGTGFGLATVYGIVKQSGGTVSCYSEVGHGTTFKVLLPRVVGPIEQFPAPARISGRAARTRGFETILLVEDEATLRDLTGRILEKYGYTVLEAGSADEALAVAAAHNGMIHLLLADIVLPGANGRALADELRTRRHDLRVLFMSGYTEDAMIHRGVLEPHAAFINKPYSAEQLAGRVRDVLDG